MKDCHHNKYTPLEEKLHVWTHSIAFCASLVALYVLLLRSDHRLLGELIGYCAYGMSLLSVFLFSSLYHQSKDKKKRLLLRQMDHMSIYLLIAGTNTPIAIKYLNHPRDLYYLWIIWLVAFGGIFAKFFFYSVFKKLDLAYYILMGLLGAIVVILYVERIPSSILYHLFIGGLCYLFGVVFYMMDSMKYHHVLWHIWVILGASFHFRAIWLSTF